jgi:uncharacterized damage-inducible protein DinB
LETPRKVDDNGAACVAFVGYARVVYLHVQTGYFDAFRRRLPEEIKGKGAKEMLAQFEGDLKEARTRLAAADDTILAQQWKMVWGDQTVVDMPREQVLRKWVMNHLIHHRAQLGVFLRLNGIPIPGAYGPSADEMPS